VRSWIEDNLGPRGKIADAGQSLAAVAHLAVQAPAILERGARIVEKLETWTGEGLTLAPHTLQGLAQAHAALNRFWRYGFAVLILTVVLHFWR